MGHIAVDMGNPQSKLLHKRNQACAVNSFVGSLRRHLIVARYLKIIMNNVQRNYYSTNPLLLTGPCAFGRAVRAIKKNFGKDTINMKWPMHNKNQYYWNDRTIAVGKCKFCGIGQDWSNGNNYNSLIRNRTFYCEDSASIFG